MPLVTPHRISQGKAQVHVHDRMRAIRRDAKGAFVIAWKWSKMKVYITIKETP